VLHDDAGYLVVAVSSTHRLQLDTLRDRLGHGLNLATEAEIGRTFGCCEVGAVPAIGAAYGLPVMCDESLATEPAVHFEAGNDMELVRADGPALGSLMKNAT